jgi:hypothetical protein
MPFAAGALLGVLDEGEDATAFVRELSLRIGKALDLDGPLTTAQDLGLGMPAQALRLAGITTVAAANVYLREVHVPEHNARFGKPAAEPGTAFCGFVDNANALTTTPQALPAPQHGRTYHSLPKPDIFTRYRHRPT